MMPVFAKERVMRKAIGFAIAFAGLASSLAVMASSAHAQAGQAYCAMQGGREGYENCGYFTMAQCRAAVSGVGGFCIANPRYAERPYGDDGRVPPPRYRERRAY
jgi:hypothetical protein